MNRTWTCILVWLMIPVFGLALACGDDETGDSSGPGDGEEVVSEDSPVVGGGCFDNEGCEERCLTGSDWPGGMCTLDCDSDSDCPDASNCIAKERGVCLMECGEDDDCPSGYECDDEDREGHAGKVYVCVKD